jgi:hypothetical protein
MELTMTEIEVLPAHRPAASEAIGQLMAHAEAMHAAKQLGDALAGTDMVPKDYKNKPGNAAAAILYGAELGLNPIQSLQQIFVIHGSPAIYARTAVALVMRHGVRVETLSSDNESVTVQATDPRTGQVERATWDIARATLAAYTSNAKYQTNPQEMLYAKAAMEVCRKIAPDILLGIPYAREELELESAPQRVRSERASAGVASLRQRAAAAAEQPVDAENVDSRAATDTTQSEPAAKQMSEPSRRKWLNRMFQLLGQGNCSETEDQLIVIAALAGLPIGGLEHRDALNDDELRAVVNQLNVFDKGGQLATEIAKVRGAADMNAENGGTGGE